MYALLIVNEFGDVEVEHMSICSDDSVDISNSQTLTKGLNTNEVRKVAHLTSFVRTTYPSWKVYEKINVSIKNTVFKEEYTMKSFYVVTLIKSGRGPSSKCLISGPYATNEEASNMCVDKNHYIDLLTKEEANKITY